MNDRELIKAALEARDFSYSPYSGFSVGAALLCSDGKVYTGCNIESSVFTPTTCAERTAFFKAISEGRYDFVRIAVVGGKVGQPASPSCTPCGVCRQVMKEFCKPDFKIIMASSETEYTTATLEVLLPRAFDKSEVRSDDEH